MKIPIRPTAPQANSRQFIVAGLATVGFMTQLLFFACSSTTTSDSSELGFKYREWGGQEWADGMQELLEPASLTCDDSCEFCIETPNGMECAVACGSGQMCPQDYVCMIVSDNPWCVVPGARLCIPCTSNDQCIPQGLGQMYRCADWGDGKGSFCTMTCNDLIPCPTGYKCEDRGSGLECYPESLTCKCTPLALALNLSTNCYYENKYGKCKGEMKCTPTGMSPCTAQIPDAEACNGIDDDCDGLTDEDFVDQNQNGIADCFEKQGIDSDNDGDPDQTDCAPYNSTIHHGATEACNGKDDDCDGETDEDFPDTNGDGQPDCPGLDSDSDGIPDEVDNCPLTKNPDQQDLDLDGQGDVCDPDDDGDQVEDQLDCAPTDPKIYPDAEEKCDGVDQNCNGIEDEGFPDSDGDGIADCVDPDDDNDSAPDSQDCKPTDPTIHPQAKEKCNGIDDNCDGQTDEENAQGCSDYYKDSDGDGYGSSEKKCLCAPSSSFSVAISGDCDDSNPDVHPQAEEKCNGIDDDCDGKIDPQGTCEVAHKICIDPGDGGSEPGAVGIVVEKDVNLSMGLKTKEWLQKDTNKPEGGGAWTVLMTRESDITVSLASRVDYANSNGAQRFISIHNNSCGGCGGHGTETYKKTGANSITTTLAQQVQNQLVASLGLTDRGVKTNNFYVLTNTTMPAVLTLPGFVDHAGDVAVINSASGLNNTGKALLHALQQSFGLEVFTP